MKDYKPPNDDKFVDCDGGKNHVVLITQQGKIFASGSTFHESLHDDVKN